MGVLKALSSLTASAFAGRAGRASSCYVPPPEEVFYTPLSEAADAFLTACNRELNAKQERLAEQWFAGAKAYQVDLERGTLRLERESGPPVLFDVALVGSHDRETSCWEWAWNNPNVEVPLAVPKASLAQIGKRFNLKYLLYGFVPVPMADFPMYLSGIALKVTNAYGVHVADHGNIEFYLLLKDPRSS